MITVRNEVEKKMHKYKKDNGISILHLINYFLLN